ncbi:PAS domain S-box protein [Salinibaculum rarum]|uniref:PAS domain S-box protein n=1 Tax=Salinibaculum rarum TaxID=3058903 RepID=UPI00265EBE3E|nr:PAS domain S-box protein [Salinibaculum sp. KK48]
MNALHTMYILLFTGAGFTCLGTLLQTRRLASRDVRRGLAALLVLSGLWALAVVAQLLASSFAVKKLLYTVGLVFGFGTVFAWLYFVSAYTGRQFHRDRKVVAAGAGLFGLAALIKVTNSIHGAYFTATLKATPFSHIVVDHSAIHWLLTGVAYTLSGVGFWLIYDAFKGRETPVTLYALIGATALPIVPYFLAALFPDLLLRVNYEPLGVAIFAVGVLFFVQDSFLELSSPGHSQLVDILSEGVVLLDENDGVVSYNDHAKEAFSELTQAGNIEAVDADLAALSVGEQCIVTTTVDGVTHNYQATRKAIDTGPQFIATAVTLTRVTRLVHLEEITRVHSKVNEAIIEEQTQQGIKERVCDELASVDAYQLVWIGTSDGTDVAPEYVAGETDEYLSEGLVDPASGDTAQDPVVEAVTNPDQPPGFVETIDDEGGSGWQRAAAKAGITACLTMSLSPGEQNGSVLGIYTSAEEGFSESEQAMFAEIRETLQHAISAIEAHEEARQFQAAVNQAGYALFITDVDGTIRYVNPAFEESTGYRTSEVIGRTPDFLTEDTDCVSVWDDVTSGSVWEGDVHNRRKGGGHYWARRTVAPVTDGSGEVTAVVAIDVDVTDERVRQQRLTVLNRVVRHNLRNRMNVIAGNASVLLHEDEPTPDGAEPAAQIRDTASELIELSEKAHTAEQLIDASENSEENIGLATLLKGLRDKMASEYPESTIETSLPKNSDISVDAALKPALVELASNGLEHGGSDPHLRIDATVESASESDREEVVLTIADDGPGLPEAEREVLENGEESALRHGSGLGLWLVNWLILQSGGTLDISVDSSGTTVTARVPTQSSQKTYAPNRSVSL